MLMAKLITDTYNCHNHEHDNPGRRDITPHRRLCNHINKFIQRIKLQIEIRIDKVRMYCNTELMKISVLYKQVVYIISDSLDLYPINAKIVS